MPDLCISGRNLTKSSWLRGSLVETMIIYTEDNNCILSSPRSPLHGEVQVTHQLGVDGYLAPDQRVAGGETSGPQLGALRLDTNLVLVTQLAVQPGRQGSGARLGLVSIRFVLFAFVLHLLN